MYSRRIHAACLASESLNGYIQAEAQGAAREPAVRTLNGKHSQKVGIGSAWKIARRVFPAGPCQFWRLKTGWVEPSVETRWVLFAI